MDRGEVWEIVKRASEDKVVGALIDRWSNEEEDLAGDVLADLVGMIGAVLSKRESCGKLSFWSEYTPGMGKRCKAAPPSLEGYRRAYIGWK